MINLTTGKIKVALPSDGQEVNLLEQLYNNEFKLTTLEDLKANEGMKEGEIGIIYAYKIIRQLPLVMFLILLREITG